MSYFTHILHESKIKNNEHFSNDIQNDKKGITIHSKQNSKNAVIFEKEEKPEEILRGAGFKIRLVTPTSFGTQIDFAKKYDDDEIERVLKDFTIKLKNKSVFIVD